MAGSSRSNPLAARSSKLPIALSASGSVQPYTVLDPRLFSASSAVTAGEVSDDESERIIWGTIGQNCYPVAPDTDEILWRWNEIIQRKAKERGLDFFDTIFWVYERDGLLKAAARGGFPRNIPHWKWGKEFKELRLGHQYMLQKIYEMVINNDPAHAYLLKGNSLLDQKLVMCHVMAHVDFFKNNIHFQHTNRNMVDRIAEHADYIDEIQDKGVATKLEVEKFLDKAFSVEHLIDNASLKPREIKYELVQTKEAEPVPNDFGMVKYDEGEKVPWHIRELENDPQKIAEAQRQEAKRREEELRKTPRLPDRDVLGFIIEHSTVLKTWQRRVLGFVREQSYYFAPQAQTKIMNEGWASHWHDELMNDPDIIDARHISDYADHNSGTLAKHPMHINPYSLGRAIFRDIKERWDKGRHGLEWDLLEDRKARREYDTKEMKGLEKIFEVRKYYKDIDFIQEFLTPELAEKEKLFTFDKQSNYDGEQYVISGREFEEIKKRLLANLAYGHNTDIMVLNGNYKNRGELLLDHNFLFELKHDYALETTKNLLFLWGRPVHLDTRMTFDNAEEIPVRITAEYVDIVGADKKKPGTRVTIWKRQAHVAGTSDKDKLYSVTEEIKEDEDY